MLFALTDDPHFYGLKVPLNNILMIDLFRLYNRIIIFSKTKKIISHQMRNGQYIFDVNMEVGGVLKFATCL